MKRTLVRRDAGRGQNIRFWMQIAFASLCVWIGVEFVLWYMHQNGGGGIHVSRPAGVEGFLPISALMSLWYWMHTGDFHHIHPAGTVILSAIIALSFVFKKSFCSWFCPVGTISESVGEFGRKLFGRNIVPWPWLDIPLRSLKYLMLAFLVYVVFFGMDAESLRVFLDSPYNRVADVKMMLFFTELSGTGVSILLALLLLSLPIKHFWCRYLCPYGALLGLVGLISPFRVTRNAASCIDCAKCAKVCPAAIRVDKARVVMSDECTSCFACVDVCPVKDTLQYKTRRVSRMEIRPAWLAAGIAAMFMLITGAAMLTGNWRNNIPEQEYTRRIKDIHNPIYQHNQGSAPAEHTEAAAAVESAP